MKTGLTFITLLTTIILGSSCQFNPRFQDKGEAFLQGVWEQDSVSYEQDLVQYTRHHFTFTCDSFYVVLHTFSKVNYGADSCFRNDWTEYAKGIYWISKDTLYLKGTFTKSNFRQKISGCYRIGEYLPVFILKNQQPKQLYLQNLQQHIPLIMQLKKKTTCKPKPI